MDATTLITALTQRGIALEPAGDRLHIIGTLTDTDRAAIRRHKAALLAALRRPARPVVLPADVHGVPLDAIRAFAGEDWPALAAAPEVLEIFVRSALLHGDLTRPEYSPDSADVLPRPALEPAPRSTRHLPLGLTPGPALAASRRFYGHLAGCRECSARFGRYCAEGEALRQTYYHAPVEGRP